MCSAVAKETFLVLPGANDSAGGRYEHLMTSYVSLKFLQNPDVKDFKLSNNSKEFGKFDDVIVEILFEDGSTETWEMQLKHSATGKRIRRDALAADKGDFSLDMYFIDHQKRKHPTNTKSVLYTNKTLQEAKAFELLGKPYTVTPYKSAVTCPLDTSKGRFVYQFNIEVTTGKVGDPDEVKNYKDFFRNFYVYANQKNAAEMEQEVTRLFTASYGPVGDDKYKTVFGEWCMKKAIEGRKEKLYKEDIQREIARIVLERHIKPIKSKVSCANGNTLKTIISKFDVTVIDAASGNLIEHLWASCDPPHNWNNADFPVILTVNESNATSVHEAVNVLRKDHKFILVGDCVDVTKFGTCKIFENLSDLQTDDFKDVAHNFSCVIQGRESTCLGKILEGNEKLTRFFKVGHLLEMVEKSFVIGDETVALPKPYIDRSIPKHMFKCSLIRNLANEVLVITCGDENELSKMVNHNKNFESTVIDITDSDFMIEHEVPMILISKNKVSAGEFHQICSKIKDRSVFYFELCEGFLNLLSTHDCKLSKLMEFRHNDGDKTIPDSEILSNFMNKTNVLLADPGMGKTICAEFIKLICPFDAWPIKINLREKLHLFRNSSGVEDLLGKILYSGESALIRSFQDYYKSDKQIMLIWDGLDEVGTDNVDLVIGKIKQISRCGYCQWLTSRCHLKEKLESFFNVLSVTLIEATADDQQKYIEEGLRLVYGANIKEVTANIHERIVKSKLKDMLGIPLLLHMFTTICSNTQYYERIRLNEVSITQIYGMFVDANFDKFADKVVKTENPLFSQVQAEFKVSRMTSYSEAAMMACFDKEFLENVKLECDGFLQGIAKSSDVFGLITMIADNNTPIFWHKTFAEYFAALYLANKHERLSSSILIKLFQREYRNIRLLFDMCLSENHPAHQAVLAMNLSKLKEIAEKNEDMIFLKDDGGRNVLHLACSYGTMREPLIRSTTDELNLYSRRRLLLKAFRKAALRKVKGENKDYAEILKYLVHLADQKKNQSVNHEDQIYELNCVQYADASLSLYAIEALCEISEVRTEIKTSICNYKNNEETVVTYSIMLDYENLLAVFERLPYFELVEDSSLHSLTNNFNDLSSCNIFLLIIEFGRIDLLKEPLKISYPEILIGNFINLSFENTIGYDYYEFDEREKTRTSQYVEISPLFWAVKKGNLGIFKLLIQYGADLKMQYGQKQENNILHVAVEQGQISIVKHITRKKLADIDIRNKQQETPLLVASRTGHSDIINYLIGKGAAIDATNSLGQNLLHCACEWGHLEIVQDLVENKKNLFKTLDSDKDYALSTAAYRGQFEICKYLIRNGAKSHPSEKETVLHSACWYGDREFVQNLIEEHSYNVNSVTSSGITPLSCTISRNHLEIKDYLLRKGANDIHVNNSAFVKKLQKEKLIESNTQDLERNNPLLFAASKGKFETVQYLLEHGANIKAESNKSRQNILHYACLYQESTFIRSLPKETLIELDTQNTHGYNPLLLAASKGNFDIVEYLLEHGANFKAESDTTKRNMLHYACLYKESTFIKNLSKQKLIALDTLDDSGQNPLQLAASKENFDIVQYLLTNGANIKAENTSKQNILHYACSCRESTFIKSLPKEKLLEFDTQDFEQGASPLLIASSFKGNFDIVQYLLQNGANIKVEDTSKLNILHFACFHNESAFVKSLPKEALFELDTQNIWGSNPLLLAASKGNFDIVRYLLENGANIKAENTSKYNILHYACLYKESTFIKSLPKEKLFEFDTETNSGYNPLLVAASRDDFDIVQYLLENGANINARNDERQNILHYACSYKESTFVKSLPKEKLSELDSQDYSGDNPLLLAASGGNFDIVQYFLENGANINGVNTFEKNMLHYACLHNESAFIKSLPKEKLIELDSQDCSGYNPLLLAARERNFDIVQYLLENGANIKAKNISKQNILHFACLHNESTFIKSLSKKHLFELDTQDNQGDNPLSLAASKGHVDIVQYLLENNII